MWEWQGRVGGLAWGRGNEWGGLNCPERFLCILKRSKTSWQRIIFISPFKQDSLPSLLFWCCAYAFVQVLCIGNMKYDEDLPSILWSVQHTVGDHIPQHEILHTIHTSAHIHTHTTQTHTQTHLPWVRFSVVCTVPQRPRSPPGAWPSPLCHAAPWVSAAPWASSQSLPYGSPHFFGSWHKNHYWTCPPWCQLVKSVRLVFVIA